MAFANRRVAGRRLADRLGLGAADGIVMALPRGGVPVAYEIAQRVGAPLDVLVVRKLGHPRQPELALGAIGEEGIRVLNKPLIRATGTTPEELDAIEQTERTELRRRVERYRAGRPALPVTDRMVIVVDDGIATGATVRAAIEILRRRRARCVVIAVPVASPEAIMRLGRVADTVTCLETPPALRSVGEWYEDFTQVGDQEVAELLADANRGAT